MNRKKKSSIILIVVFCVVSPIIYLGYQWTNNLDDKLYKVVEKSQNIIEGERQKIKDILIGTKWINDKNPSEKWEFQSDSILIKNGITYLIQIEPNVIIIKENDPIMLMCIVENSSTLIMSPVKSELSDFFGEQKDFKLIKSN